MEIDPSYKPYDVLVVGAGLTGATIANLCKTAGYKCLVIEKRPHVGGNIYTYKDKSTGIDVHQYGAHIFHTSNDEVWNYVNMFCKFEPFINSPVAKYNNEVYNLPFNMNTFAQMWPGKVSCPYQAKQKIKEEIEEYTTNNKDDNLENHAISMVGTTIYEKLIKHYTEKQWGRSCKELSSSLIKRLPLRFSFDNNYFNDKYQGIPSSGYTEMINNMLDGIDVLTNTDYLTNKDYWNNQAHKVVYTGPIDQYFNYCCGNLLWRSLIFKIGQIKPENTQGVAVVNYTSASPEYTRSIEHAYFLKSQKNAVLNNEVEYSVISYEYPCEWTPDREPYYPVSNNKENDERFEEYKNLAMSDNTIFAGRLGTYKYLDMDKAIEQAFEIFSTYIK